MKPADLDVCNLLELGVSAETPSHHWSHQGSLTQFKMTWLPCAPSNCSSPMRRRLFK